MTITEKVAYIRGLTDGLKLDESKDEVKVINKIIDLLEDMAAEYSDLTDFVDEISEQVDEIDEDLAALEDDFADLEDDFDCDEDDECDGDCCCCNGDEMLYEVTCPTCNQTVCLDEDMFLDGEVECPNCGEILEFDCNDVIDADAEEAEASDETVETEPEA